MGRADKQKALLRGRLQLALDEAAAFLDAEAARLRLDAPNIPPGVLRNQLTRGEHDLVAALRIINADT